MNYTETLQYLYNRTPAFHLIGAGAYKPGLERSHALDDAMGRPSHAFHVIHIAGTNGKGSVSHMLAAILQADGHRVGLYTSPHLVDYRERIRVNGQMIPKDEVIRFVEENRELIEQQNPSFFEVTTAMAFDYFRREKVEIAVVETGMGGRLDSTNIVDPILCIITNITLDHTQYLGRTVKEIAGEKAGIIKPDVPTIVGNASRDAMHVISDKVSECQCPFFIAQSTSVMQSATPSIDGGWEIDSDDYGPIRCELQGKFQIDNARIVLTALRRLSLTTTVTYKISREAVSKGFSHVVELTGLMGRWQMLQQSPTIVCDTGHNIGAWEYLSPMLDRISREITRVRTKPITRMRIIIGLSSDKDVDSIVKLLPRRAIYYYTQASSDRALPAERLAELAGERLLRGKAYPNVAEAVRTALADSSLTDFIFIGGSNFIVADALPLIPVGSPLNKEE